MKDPSLLKTNVCYVNGEWVEAKSGKSFEVTGTIFLPLSRHSHPCFLPFLRLITVFTNLPIADPTSGKVIGTVPEFDAADTQNAIDAAAAAFPLYRKKTGRERSKLLRKWYDLMMENSDDLTTLIVWENGKPKTDAAGEVTYAANFLEWFSEEAPRTYGDTIPASVAGNRVMTIKEPVGVCGLITP